MPDVARIDFAFGAPDRLRMACEVVSKNYLAGRELLIYTRDTPLLERFDRLLWGFDPVAFIPHVAIDDPLDHVTSVRLTSQIPATAAGERDGKAVWLVNLDRDCPPDIGQFERILEIVATDEHGQRDARERWRLYKTAGHELRAHDMAARAPG